MGGHKMIWNFPKPSDFPAQYAGPLTPAQAAEGIRVAIENARDLLADAELLFQHKRWARATALAIVATEEAGKVGLIKAMLVLCSQEHRRALWAAYRNHVQKNTAWAWLDLLVSDDGQLLQSMFNTVLEDIRAGRTAVDAVDALLGKLFTGTALHGFKASQGPQRIERIKQAALYSDALGDGWWLSPRTSIDEAGAKAILEYAREEAGKPVEEVVASSQEELELFVKHLGPVCARFDRDDAPASDTDKARVKDAIVAFLREALSRNVLRGGVADEKK